MSKLQAFDLAEVSPLNMVQGRGVIYAVTGGKSYLGELFTSVRSLRRFHPHLPVTVFSNFNIEERYGITCVQINYDDNPHKLKVLAIRRSQYEETLFLDTDTQIRGSLDPLFNELEGKDMCAANAHLADYTVRPPRFISMVKEGGYNTGVVLFRKGDPTASFLSLWERDVIAHKSENMWAGHFGDQFFFNRLIQQGALQSCGVRWGVLENIKWNCRGIAIDAVKEMGRWSDVTILHQRTNQMKLSKLVHSYSDFRTLKVILRKGIGSLGRVFGN